MVTPLFPKRIQDSKPRSQEEIRADQDEWVNHLIPEHPRNQMAQWSTKWKKEPTIEQVGVVLDEIRDKGLYPLAPAYKIKEAGRGSYNFVFKLEVTGTGTHSNDSPLPDTLAFRVTMPNDPYFKLESEIATMTFARVKADLPVPRVYCFDSSPQNALGLEWMLMDFVDGPSFGDAVDMGHVRLRNRIRGSDSERYAELISQYNHDLAKVGQFDKMGSLYCDWDTAKFFVGPCTEGFMSNGPRSRYTHISRGPFSDITSYFQCLLQIWTTEALDPDVEDEAFRYPQETVTIPELKQRRQDIILLTRQIRQFLTPFMEHIRAMNARDRLTGPIDGFRSVVSHMDLHEHNILLSKNKPHDITAILDWEKTPVWPALFYDVQQPIMTQFMFRPSQKLEIQDCNMDHGVVPLNLLLEGRSSELRSCGTLFLPLREARLPQSLALRAVDTVIQGLRFLTVEDVVWWEEAFLTMGVDVLWDGEEKEVES